MLKHAIVTLGADGRSITIHDVFKDFQAAMRAIERGTWIDHTWVPRIAIGRLDLARPVLPENVEWFHWLV